MKAITLYQPHASATSVDLKHYETRSWRTNYRGLLAIHAAKVVPKGLESWEFSRICQDVRNRMLIPLPHSSIVTICILTDCIPTDRVQVSEDERRFGDYSPGRCAWKLKHLTRLENPIECRGAQGLWTVPAEVEAKIMAQIKDEYLCGLSHVARE